MSDFFLMQNKIKAKFFLYNEGDENIALTGGITSKIYPGFMSGLTVTKNATNISVSYPSSSVTASLIYAINKIDTTHYTKLKFQYTLSGGHKTYKNFILEVANDLIGVPVANASFNTVVTDSTGELDITSCNGSYYIRVGAMYTTGNISKIWLERE